MKVRRRRFNNIDNSRQPSGIRNHSNPYSEAMGPLVKEGFVADRIQRLQGAQSKLVVPPSLPPPVPGPIPEITQKYDSCSSPEPDPLPRGRVSRNRSFGLVTPDKPPRLFAGHSFSEKRWIKSSPSTPVVRTPTGAALYWDRKIQSLRHPPTREALEIRRLKRGHRSNENVKQSMSSLLETPTRCQISQPRLEEHDINSARSEVHDGQNPSDSAPLQENEGCQTHIQIHKPSIADHMGDIINHIDQALERRYDPSLDLTAEAEVPTSDDPMDDLYGNRNASAQRQLFRESQSTEALALSEISGASRMKAPSSNVYTSESDLTSSEDELGSSMRDGGLNAQPQGGDRATKKNFLPRSSSGTDRYSPEPLSSPDARPQAWSSHHSDPLENVHPYPAKLRSIVTNHVLASVATKETAKSPEELEPLEPEASKRPQPILKEPESIHPNINDRHQPTYEVPASLSGQPPRTNRNASLSSIRSTSSQGSKKWRWWKLALVDKQPKGQAPRKRQSSPNLSGLNVRVSKQEEAEDEGKPPHLPVETILETEAEGEHASIDEMLDGTPNREAPALHSPTLAEVQTRRSSQWVASLPSPSPTVSAAQAPGTAQTPSRPGGPRASVIREAKKRDQRIRKVQVIVSLDGASDLVVEASLETKRRKSFS